jgi:hypothetical protein
MSQKKAKQPEYGAELKLTAVRRVLAEFGTAEFGAEFGTDGTDPILWP